jgi:two-component system LytT family response regulator
MKLKTIIVEDEPIARDVLRIMLQDFPQVEVLRECGNGLDAVDTIRTLKPDLVFLDVRIPDLDGLGVIHEIGVSKMPAVIFVTAYDKYAVKAFEAQALDYLLKPFDKARFRTVMKRALSFFESAEQRENLTERIRALITSEGTPGPASRDFPKRVTIKDNGRIYFVRSDEIDWFEAAGDYVTLHIGKSRHLLHETLSAIEGRLDPAKFLRIHRSVIVNVSRISELVPYNNGEYFVYLSDGTKLKLSRSYREQLKRLLDQSL